ncbi:hypothetical protein IHE55_15205 [Streptomyces pactum]|uniref:Uncharacterized protein n=1 Tax=Streptomyces pactum TaxID=68249 RepID=A0ABS0NLU0_9ACTN|nr:hypothetical protein [Streptomyces pactum]MBH5336062.1 hypothetical protein [Streptomyces pactum]
MRHLLISRPSTVLQPAWWCRLTVHSRHPGDTRATTVTHLAHEPSSALIWLRTQLRVVLHLMSPDDARAAFRWLDHGQALALLTLRAGDPLSLSGRSGAVRVELTAHPVLPLPRPTACAYRAATPRAGVDPGHRTHR